MHKNVRIDINTFMVIVEELRPAITTDYLIPGREKLKLGKIIGGRLYRSNTFLSEKVPHMGYRWKDNLKENIFHLNFLSYDVTVDVE